MKICIITGHFPARSETFVLQHVLGLARRGHTVSVLSFGVGDGISNDELEELSALGVALWTVDTFSGSRLSKTLKLAGWVLAKPSRIKNLFPQPPWTRGELYEADAKLQLLHEIEPDAIHIHYGTYAGPLLRLGLPKVPVVTWHGVDANITPKHRGESMYHEMFQQKCVNSVGSGFMEKRLLALNASPASIVQIPMGVDLSEFEYMERPCSIGNPLRVVSVGRLDEMKGHRYLIQAVSELIQSGVDLVLNIVGEGPLRDDLEKQILNSGWTQQIQLLGAKPAKEVLSELRAADIFALAGVEAANGRVETQGVVLIEAQATGLPVISSRVGGIPGSLIDGETGILCPAGDVGAIKEAILFFMENPQERQKFGVAARGFVEATFSIDTMLDAFENQYQKNQMNPEAGNCR
ncbi:MAG: colanic acid/amylovoran biosynthesis glycosyltransferase [Rubritalea sp.]|jgi:colanic acid/amylovoran biosynthesis glycosyltransferase